jgi:hypothetical protein
MLLYNGVTILSNMPQEDRVYVLDDGTKKSKYLLQYLKEAEYNPKVVTVNSKDSLVTWFENINPNDGYKVFLQFTNEDLTKDNERLRQEIQGLESKGFRNLIVLPFEGMRDSTVDERLKDLEWDNAMDEEDFDPDKEVTLQDKITELKIPKEALFPEVTGIDEEGETNNKDDTKKGTKRKVSGV